MLLACWARKEEENVRAEVEGHVRPTHFNASLVRKEKQKKTLPNLISGFVEEDFERQAVAVVGDQLGGRHECVAKVADEVVDAGGIHGQRQMRVGIGMASGHVGADGQQHGEVALDIAQLEGVLLDNLADVGQVPIVSIQELAAHKVLRRDLNSSGMRARHWDERICKREENSRACAASDVTYRRRLVAVVKLDYGCQRRGCDLQRLLWQGQQLVVPGKERKSRRTMEETLEIGNF